MAPMGIKRLLRPAPPLFYKTSSAKAFGVGMHDLVSIRDLGKKDVEAVLSEAARMEKMPHKKSGELLRGKLVSTMFFEPSTRTNMSFQAAAKRLGAKLMTFYPSVSSTAKGETLGDTIRMIDGDGDAIVLRHPYEGAAGYAADLAEHPVITRVTGAISPPHRPCSTFTL